MVDSFRETTDVELLECAATPAGLVDPEDLAMKLAARGALSLLVEGGGQVHGAFLEAGIADRIALFVAPKIAGSGPSWISFPGLERMADAHRLKNMTVETIEEDLLIMADVARDGETE